MQSVETDQLRLLYFDPTETYLVPRVIQSFHGSIDVHQKVLGYDSDEKTTMLLVDFADYGNANATAVPGNLVMLQVSPIIPSFETFAPAERMYTLMNHEMVHVATTDQPAPVEDKYRKLFRGKVLPVSDHPESILYHYLTTPRDASPRWYLEGIAVFMETWMAGGLGRAQGAYDEMMFRTMVRDNAHFYDPLGLVAEGVEADFQAGANAYLYGGRFMSYVAYTYTPERLIEWVKRTADGARAYDKEFERVFGISLNAVWNNWIEWEREFQQGNLEAAREFPISDYENLADGGLGSMSRAFYDSERNSLIAGMRYPGVVAHIGEFSLAKREVRHLEDVKVPMLYTVTSVAYDPDSETVFYAADNKAYRDLMAVDLNTGKASMLMHNARIGELVFNKTDRSIWGLRHLSGYISLVRIPYPYTEWDLVHTFPYGTVVYDTDISANGEMLSGSFGDIEGQQSIKVFKIDDLLAGNVEAMTSFDFGLAVPEGFVFSPDSRFLFGSAYYTGISNIFRYELATGELEAVSNSETGFFRPIPLDNENLIVFNYTGQGFVPARIKANPIEDVAAVTFLGTEIIKKYPQLREWQVDPHSDVPADSRIIARGEYVPAKNMRLESIYPIALGYKDSVSLALQTNFSDPVMLDTLGVTLGYSLDSDLPSEERPNVMIDYRHSVIDNTPLAGTWLFGAHWNNADFYDLFGPTEQSRKGTRFYVGFEKSLLYDEPRLLEFSTELNHHVNIDALPRYQDVVASIDKLTSFDVRLGFSHVRSSLGAVDDEKGIKWNIGATVNYVDGETIPKIGGNFDFGFALPLKNSSIWFRNAVGAAFGDETDEFANFFFGGFGNNYVDHQDVQRYRDFYAMPGFELNEIPGRNFHRAMLEWNLPPIRFSRAGTSNFYASWARPALFVTSLVTNLDERAVRQEAYNIGAQVDFEFALKSRYPLTLSLGYAKGLGSDPILDDDEFMVSLKIL
ncbi:MAG: hypothetical protein ACR2RD_08085 [Woeseiaceae bacterium]